MMDEKLVGLPGRFEENLPHGDVTVSYSESPFGGGDEGAMLPSRPTAIAAAGRLGPLWSKLAHLSRAVGERAMGSSLKCFVVDSIPETHGSEHNVLASTGPCLPEAKGTGCDQAAAIKHVIKSLFSRHFDLWFLTQA